MKKTFNNIVSYYKSHKVKAIIFSLLIVFGLIFFRLFTILATITFFLWKKFKSEEKALEGHKKICPHCKEEVNLNATRCSHCHGKINVWTAKKKIIAVIFVCIVILIVFKGGAEPIDNYLESKIQSNQTINTEVLSDTPILELVNFHCTEEYGYFEITGQVKNISDKSLKNVMAVGNTYTKTDQFVNSNDSIIEYDPILPGQTSPFKVMMTSNPEMTKCDVDFKYMFGGSINTKIDSLKKK